MKYLPTTLLLILLLTIIQCNEPEIIEASIKKTDDGKWEIRNFTEIDYVAKATYEKRMNENGTDTLSITTNSIYSDEIQAEGAGRIEGYLTKERIYQYHLNLIDEHGPLDDSVINFFEEQEKFVEENKNADEHMYVAYLVLTQLKGIRDMYNEHCDADKKLKNTDFTMIAAIGDLGDIEDKFKKVDFSKMNENELRDHFLKSTHCSALFKTKEDFTDFYMGHNSWDSFSAMLRILKEYNFNFNYGLIKAKNIMFSSYPASVSSNDDFFITSQNLVVIETTNAFYNTDLYNYTTPQTLLNYQRVMVANRLATNAEEWGKHYTPYNSGTYNNMYMVLDLKRINLEIPEMKPKSFFITETVPGYSVSHDMTDFLRYGYWPSYNTPYDEKIRKLSKLSENEFENPLLKNMADLTDYDMCNRAVIFRRDQYKVTDLQSFMKIIRYNNYDKETYKPQGKNIDPCNTLAARCDLRKDQPKCFGAYDAKVVSASELAGDKKIFHFMPGPTNDVPEGDFRYDQTEICKKIKHEGIPNLFNFTWYNFTNTYSMKDY